MKAERFKVPLMIGAVVLACVALVWQGEAIDRNEQTVQALGVQTQALATRGEIVELPEDGTAYQVSVFVHHNWRERKRDREVVAAWSVDPRLASLKPQVHWRVFTNESTTYQKFAKHIPQLPAVFIQRPGGMVVWKGCEGGSLPASAAGMGDAVGQIFKRPIYILPWRRPKPCPVPHDTTPVDKPPVEDGDFVPPIADTLVQEPEEEPFPWWLTVGLCMTSALVTTVAHVKGVFAG